MKCGLTPKENQAKNTCCDDSGSKTCCQHTNQPHLIYPWLIGQIGTKIGIVPVVSTRLKMKDVFGSWKARWGIGRMNYRIAPGLYAVGNPDSNSSVLVSANYKMSFDRLRRELTGLNLWILVLDTKGINVWCAAGKGTFGTEELVKRIILVKLSEIVAHRILIVPQLGAAGIAAHLVSKYTGFKVVYGPVRASDIPDFLKLDLVATPAMRQVSFGLIDRLVLTPMEVVGVVKPALLLIAALFAINLVGDFSATFAQLVIRTTNDFIPFMGAFLTGAVLVPLFLPYIPGRALAWKGWLLGVLWTGISVGLLSPITNNWPQTIIYLLLLPPITSYLALNFTGATTYTSPSGVAREMKIALPAQIVSVGLGITLLIGRIIIRF